MWNKFLFAAICIVCLGVFSFQIQSEEVIRFHEVKISASSIHLVKFNISDFSKVAFVKEIIDDKGRTKELRFYDSGQELAYAGSGFYGGPIMRYDYFENKIVETFYIEENEIAHDFKDSEVPYRFTYHLNGAKEISSIEQKYKMDFDWENESLCNTIKHLEEYKKYNSVVSELESVFGFQYAYAKMNGINPIITIR